MSDDHKDIQDELAEFLNGQKYAYGRIARESTGSRLTVGVSTPLGFDAWNSMVEAYYPGWEVLILSIDNPDKE